MSNKLEAKIIAREIVDTFYQLNEDNPALGNSLVNKIALALEDAYNLGFGNGYDEAREDDGWTTTQYGE